MSNKADFQQWKTSPVTKLFLEHAADAQEAMRDESCIRDTVDQTAMQVARNEGFLEGVDALGDFIRNMILKYNNEEEETNED